MSDVQESISGGGILDPVEITQPTPEDTQAALARCDTAHADAAVVLNLLCTRLLQVIHELDDQTNLSKYVNSVTVVGLGDGHFRIDVDDKNTGIGQEGLRQLGDEIAQRVELEIERGGKPLRTIELEQGEEDHAGG